MTEKELTCVVCPAGCKMIAVLDDDGNVVSVTGNTCIRGKKYAESEISRPARTLTSTIPVATDSGTVMLPVKTSRPIPKDSIFEAMKIIHRIRLNAPIASGESIIIDFIERGTNLIACKDVE